MRKNFNIWKNYDFVNDVILYDVMVDQLTDEQIENLKKKIIFGMKKMRLNQSNSLNIY